MEGFEIRDRILFEGRKKKFCTKRRRESKSIAILGKKVKMKGGYPYE